MWEVQFTETIVIEFRDLLGRELQPAHLADLKSLRVYPALDLLPVNHRFRLYDRQRVLNVRLLLDELLDLLDADRRGQFGGHDFFHLLDFPDFFVDVDALALLRRDELILNLFISTIIRSNGASSALYSPSMLILVERTVLLDSLEDFVLVDDIFADSHGVTLLLGCRESAEAM